MEMERARFVPSHLHPYLTSTPAHASTKIITHYPSPKYPWPFKWIWKLDIPPKLQIFLWQICHNSLPVRDILFQRHIIPITTCPACNNQPKTLEHCFLNCMHTRDLCSLAQVSNWCPTPMSFPPMLQFLQ